MLVKQPTRKRSVLRMFGIVVCTGLLLSVAGLALLSFNATRPNKLGVRNGTLTECPDKPNCVSSFAESRTQSMPPIPIVDDPDAAMQAVLDAISAMDGAKIISSEDDYIHCEFTTPIFRFVDDVEFLLDRNDSVIHFRSASRTGYDDFGVNRARMNEVRRRIAVATGEATLTNRALSAVKLP